MTTITQKTGVLCYLHCLIASPFLLRITKFGLHLVKKTQRPGNEGAQQIAEPPLVSGEGVRNGLA